MNLIVNLYGREVPFSRIVIEIELSYTKINTFPVCWQAEVGVLHITPCTPASVKSGGLAFWIEYILSEGNSSPWRFRQQALRWETPARYGRGGHIRSKREHHVIDQQKSHNEYHYTYPYLREI